MGLSREDAAMFCVVLFSLWTPASALLSPKVVDFEMQALMGIKNYLTDPHGVLENWDSEAVDPCSWTMVTCSSDSLVIGLGSPSQNLSGTLSPSIGNLTNLEFVLLQNNNISGQIPSELERLSKLQTLDISHNSFTGEIPTSLAHLKSLQYLRLNNNSLSGAVPSSLANMTQLAFLFIGNPLICKTGTEEDCYQMPLTQPSLALNSSQNLRLSRRQNGKVALAVGLSLGSICLLIAGFGFLLWRRQKQSQKILHNLNEQQEEVGLENLKRFQFNELQIATDNFSSKNILGKGGFGNVYKGYLQDGSAVAVKRLKDINAIGGEFQFQNEVKMISLAVHRNLLQLNGFCMTATERLLVYPYMSNGSVSSRLKAKPALDWDARKRIALGTARGLLYLHEQCDPKIIHRDVKAANILLDDDNEAVVGDFGLAKLLDHRDSHVTTAVRGTAGYIAPEYLSTGQSSDKTDVFAFGILILELITGQRAIEFENEAYQEGAFLNWVRKIHREKKHDLLVDRELNNNYDPIELEKIVQVSLLCSQHIPSQRPKMAEVVCMLQEDRLSQKCEVS